jgi:hypothetical protein
MGYEFLNDAGVDQTPDRTAQPVVMHEKKVQGSRPNAGAIIVMTTCFLVASAILVSSLMADRSAMLPHSPQNATVATYR